MASILIIYSTTDGHTLRICEVLRDVASTDGHEVTLVAVEDADAVDLGCFDRIVVGARIRYGHHSPLVYDFIRRHHGVLESRPNAFFSVNVVARKPDKSGPQTNPYVRKFLKQTPWRPRHVAVFAGKIDYPKYGPLDRMIIRFIMWMTRGPTDPKAVVEFTDWRQVEAFGRLIAGMQDSGDPAHR